MSCHDGCIGCRLEESHGLSEFFHGYSQALSHGVTGLAIHIDEACPKHKAAVCDYVVKAMQFLTEHATNLEPEPTAKN